MTSMDFEEGLFTASSHSEAADKFANVAQRLLREKLEAEYEPSQEQWARLRAVQAQAQIHATLAVNDQLFQLGFSRPSS